jgi:hypothetical protein
MKLWPEPKLIQRWIAILILMAFVSQAFTFLCHEQSKASDQIIKAAQAYQQSSLEIHACVDLVFSKTSADDPFKNQNTGSARKAWRLYNVHKSITQPIFIHVTTHAP